MQTSLKWKLVCIFLLPSLPLSKASTMRISDPTAFVGSNFPSIYIGIPKEHADADVAGEPLTQEEFHYPLMVVDPPMAGERDDPIEQPGHFEGDIMLKTVDEFLHLTSKKNPLMRSATNLEDKFWPGGKVPYQISSKFNRYERGTIALAMKNFHDLSCVSFHPRENETDYIYLIKADGCASSVGRTRDMQIVSLGKGCISKGVVIHELMHTLGFYHEQSRPDRDDYITIMWDNISPGLEHNFYRYDLDTMLNTSVKYDLGSIMHYSSRAFSKNKSLRTIIPFIDQEIGQRYGLSKGDIQKVREVYKCAGEGNIESCFDTNSACPHIANPKECNSSAWMRDNCPKSCKLCGNNAKKPLKVSIKDCKKWADSGECFINSVFMLEYCKKQCDAAKNAKVSIKPECVDVNPKCKRWAKSEECMRNPSYMLIYCAQSCKNCTLIESNGQKTP